MSDYSLQQAKLDIARLQSQMNAYERIAGVHPNMMDVQGILTCLVPQARVYNSADLTFANNTETTFTFNSEKFDNDNIHDTTTNTGRLTCRTAGSYYIWGNAQYAASSTGDRQLIIYYNGTTVSIGYDSRRARAIGPTHSMVQTVYKLAVDDYVLLRGSQNSGGNLAITANSEHSPIFGMIYIGGLE